MMSFKDNRVSIPPKRFRFGLSDDWECHSYLQVKAFDSRFFGQEFEYTRVSIPLKRFRIGLSGDGDCDSSQEYKNLVLIFSECCSLLLSG